MAAYLIAEINVTDPEKFEKYRGLVPAVIKQYGGRYLVRGGAVTPIEGSPADHRIVVLEFDSMDAAKAFYYSPEYKPLIELRLSASDGQSRLVEGYTGEG